MSVQIISFRHRQERNNVCVCAHRTVCNCLYSMYHCSSRMLCNSPRLLILYFYLSVSSPPWQSHVNSLIQQLMMRSKQEGRRRPNRSLIVTTNTCPCHPTSRGWRRDAVAGTGSQTHGWTRVHAHTHILLITQVTGSLQEHTPACLFLLSVLTWSLLAVPWKYTNFVFLSCLVWLQGTYTNLYSGSVIQQG